MESTSAIQGGTPAFPAALPFARPTLPEFREVEKELRLILESGNVTKGPFLEQYEKELVQYLGVPYALGMVNCTISLSILMRALGLSGEVIVPSFSFSASFHAIFHAGCTPVFVDCEADTFTIDSKKVEEAVTPRTSGILGVTIFGNPPDIEALEEIARSRKLALLFDSAHAFGSLYRGKPMGSHGDGEVFSTSATKLVATGEGGVITTSHGQIAEFIRQYREYGNPGDYDCTIPGTNGRLAEIPALLGLKSLPYLESLAVSRNTLADIYRSELKDLPGLSFQVIRGNCRSSYKDFAIIVDADLFGLNRDQLAVSLQAENIPTRKYFHPPGHHQKCYRELFPDQAKNELPVTNRISTSILNLPIYSHMEPDTVRQICSAIRRIYRNRETISGKVFTQQYTHIQ